jgi:molybdate transport system substrate-binding protein
VKALLLALLSLLSVPRTGSTDDVTVFAAASLAEALEEAARGYEQASGNKVVLNVGGSNDLARQIVAGAAADLFFSADRAQMDMVENAGLVRRADRVELLSNLLVVLVPAAAATRIASPSDLTQLRRIAVADPEAVPAGVYARTYLESLGLWAALRPRVIPTLNVRAALAAVESGNVDAGIVYRTDAALSRRVRVAFTVPREHGPNIAYVLAPLASSRKPATVELARRLAGPEARAVFEKHGFVVIEPGGAASHPLEPPLAPR